MQVLRLSRATTSHCLEGFGIHVLNAPFDGTHPATKSIAVSGNTLREHEFTGVAAEGDVRVTLSDNTLG